MKQGLDQYGVIDAIKRNEDIKRDFYSSTEKIQFSTRATRTFDEDGNEIMYDSGEDSGPGQQYHAMEEPITAPPTIATSKVSALTSMPVLWQAVGSKKRAGAIGPRPFGTDQKNACRPVCARPRMRA